MVVTIEGQQYYLWRAVDAEGKVLDVLLQRQRYECGQAILARTPEETRLHAKGNRHRQTQELRSGEETSHGERRAPTA